MKKLAVLFAVMCLGGFSASAQFLYSIGAAAGQSFSQEYWSMEQWETKEKYLQGLNAAVFAEFFNNPNFKWRSELMYNQLGTKEYVNTIQYVNKTNYISFNNYLKCSLPQFSWTPYFLIGPRLEDLAGRNAGIFPDAIAGMSTFRLAGAVGIGIEQINFSHIKPFVEVFYSRDIIPSLDGHTLSNYPNVSPGTTVKEIINNQDVEWRIGLKYVFTEKTKCPPVYNPAGNPPGAQ
jgi:hypothetical protein